MARRVHVERITPGRLLIDPAGAHHLRDVLRMAAGDEVELFDTDGQVAQAVLTRVDAQGVEAEATDIRSAGASPIELTLAAAVPKGPRADWMIEKLSELGIHRFIPLIARRSVVVPEGRNKLDRWRRIALEAARQSGRAGVPRVDEPMALPAALAACAAERAHGCVATTEPAGAEVRPLGRHLIDGPLAGSAESRALWVFIGPEGGWEASELTAMRDHHLTPITLGPTILRIETAALAAAAIVASLLQDHTGPS